MSVSRSRSPPPRRRPISRSRSPVEKSTVFIRNLTKNVGERHLEEIFGMYGKVKSLDLPVFPRCECHCHLGSSIWGRSSDDTLAGVVRAASLRVRTVKLIYTVSTCFFR